MDLQPTLVESLHGLSNAVDDKVHLLASSGDEQLSEIALQVTKHLFDLGVTLEESSHAQIHPFLASIAEPTGIQLRSASLRNEMEDSPARLEPEQILPHTPLSELTTSNLEFAQVWEQLELRAPGYVKVAKEIVQSGAPPEMGDLQEEEDLEEEGSDEEMDEEEFRRMLEEGELGDLTDEQIEEMMAKAEEEGDSDEDESGSEDEDDDDEEDSEGDDMSGSEDDEVTFEDGTRIGDSDEEEDEEEDGEMLGSGSDLEMDDDEEEDGENDDDDEAEEEDEEDDSALAGPSRRRRHPTLDDQFFSIDEFNRMTEEAEASHLSSGRLDDDEEEELDEDVGQLMLNGVGDDDEIMYTDFFDAPRTIEKPVGKSKSKPKAGKSKGKGKGKNVQFGDEDEEDEEALDEDAREVMGRFKEDLFADDDEEEEADDQPMSTFEKRQKALADQIAQYEQEAVGPKDWTLLGEASSRARPENSLLEEDLDFEHVRKMTPTITEESVKSLEDLIKKRILDNDFNSTVRVRAYEPTPFLASRYFELQDKQSSKSLAEIYEEEYQTAASGGKAVDPRDAKLKKDHQEIEDLWNDICYKLDALSSLNFVPKQPKAQITTISNLPTTSMETALPSTSTASTMLAPEELLQPATQSSLVARSELTPEEAQRIRERKRKAKKQDRKHLGDMAELYGKTNKKGGTKGEKERALQGLVKSGKGVTVVGKSDKEVGKGRKRGSEADDVSKEDGKRLKL